MRAGMFLVLGVVVLGSMARGEERGCAIERAAVVEPYVWVLCEERELMVTADGGASWQRRRVPVEAKLRAVAFLDSRRGFVVGDRGTMLATEDGAETWRVVKVPTEENLTAIQFVGEQGWAAGWMGVILHSEDGGKSWERQQSGVLQGLEDIFFLGPKQGWAVGWLGTILRTEDGGKRWQRATAPSMFSLNGVYFRDSREGVAVGFGGQLLKSTDGGVTWQAMEAPVRDWFKSVTYDGRGRWWIGSDRAVLVKEDGETEWKALPVDGQFVRQVVAVGERVWAIGKFGILEQRGEGSGWKSLALRAERAQAGSGSNL